MADFKTYAQVRLKVERELDIQAELFVTDAEILDYCNEAIDEAEAEIHALYEDYFLAKASLSLVAAQSEYSLPTNIYGNKIRALIYEDGTSLYPIKRFRMMDKFEDFAWTNRNLSGSDTETLRYLILNQSTVDGYKMLFAPTPVNSRANVITLWYLRQANRVAVDADVIDIPEFTQFVVQYMKMKVYEKEANPKFQLGLTMVEQQRKQMQETLTRMVNDNDDEIQQDTSSYEEMS